MDTNTCRYPGCTNAPFMQYANSFQCKTYNCNVCSKTVAISCTKHWNNIELICPRHVDNINNIRSQHVLDLLPRNFRYSSIIKCTRYSSWRNDFMLHLEHNIYMYADMDKSRVRVYKPTKYDNIYTLETYDKIRFLEEHEQYTCKPILDSLTADGYISVLPRDITGIIRMYL